jgi:hypothetical protein
MIKMSAEIGRHELVVSSSVALRDSTSDRLVSGRDGFQRQQQYCTLGFPSCAVPEDGGRVM